MNARSKFYVVVFRLLIVFHCSVQAYTIDLPSSGEQASSSTFVFRPNNGTLQWVVSSSLLSGLTSGDQIGGITFRSNGGFPFSQPMTNISYLNWNLSISQSAQVPGSLSATFADNYGSDLTMVRSGPLAINAGSFPIAADSPEPWGPVIAFQTPYTYAGGDLLFTLSQNTSFEISGLTVDATTSAATSFYQARFGAGYNATLSTSASGTPAFQLVVPEPTVLGLTSLTAFLLIATRRR
jgi:hypothetical protein